MRVTLCKPYLQTIPILYPPLTINRLFISFHSNLFLLPTPPPPPPPTKSNQTKTQSNLQVNPQTYTGDAFPARPGAGTSTPSSPITSWLSSGAVPLRLCGGGGRARLSTCSALFGCVCVVCVFWCVGGREGGHTYMKCAHKPPDKTNQPTHALGVEGVEEDAAGDAEEGEPHEEPLHRGQVARVRHLIGFRGFFVCGWMGGW